MSGTRAFMSTGLVGSVIYPTAITSSNVCVCVCNILKIYTYYIYIYSDNLDTYKLLEALSNKFDVICPYFSSVLPPSSFTIGSTLLIFMSPAFVESQK